MVMCDIGQNRRAELAPPDPAHIKCVGRHLNHRILRAMFQHRAEIPLQHMGLRCGVYGLFPVVPDSHIQRTNQSGSFIIFIKYMLD
ncbi:hypothetical protein D3C74_326310 [compost metagenome]